MPVEVRAAFTNFCREFADELAAHACYAVANGCAACIWWLYALVILAVWVFFVMSAAAYPLLAR